MYFHYFLIISPWKRAGPFIWTNLNPFHPRMLCAKFGLNWTSGSGEEDFLISSMYFHYFVIISPWKGQGPSFEQTWISFTQGCFMPSLVEIGKVVLEKKMKMWKVYRQTDGRTTDEWWSEKLTWAFSSGELKNNQLIEAFNLNDDIHRIVAIIKKSTDKIRKWSKHNYNKMCLWNTNAPNNAQFQRWPRSQGQISWYQ